MVVEEASLLPLLPPQLAQPQPPRHLQYLLPLLLSSLPLPLLLPLACQ